MTSFRQHAAAITRDIIADRRELHRHPELGFQETWTTAYITEKLKKLNIEITPWGGETGVVGLLCGAEPGPCVALRADIDALPVDEKTGLEFCSTRPGFMHACGHDSHTAALLGAAKLLVARKDQLKGCVKFIFQPAEEVISGAETMVAQGVLKNPDVDFIFGMHCSSDAPTGTVLLASGPLMAAVAATTLTITGQGGHGALPHQCKDPIIAAAGVLQALQTIVSRQVNPHDAAVITFGSIHGGTAGNIIPDSVSLQGTVRVFNPQLYQDMEERMAEVIHATAKAYQTSAEFTYTRLVPSVYNPEQLADWVRGPMAAVFGQENIQTALPSMGGEDFARFQEKVPGFFAWFGSANTAKGINAPWHNPKFTVDEDAIPLAAAAYAQVAWDWLQKPPA